MEKNSNRLLVHPLILLVLSFISFAIVVSCLIQPYIHHYGKLAEGHVYGRSERLRSNMVTYHYWYKVNGIEYKGKAEFKCESSFITVEYLPICPQIHFIHKE